MYIVGARRGHDRQLGAEGGEEATKHLELRQILNAMQQCIYGGSENCIFLMYIGNVFKLVYKGTHKKELVKLRRYLLSWHCGTVFDETHRVRSI